MQNKFFIFFIIVSLQSNFIWTAGHGNGSQAKAANEMKSRVQSASAVELLQVFESQKTTAFGKNKLIKEGLPAKDLKGWNDLIPAAHELVQKAVDSQTAPVEYKTYVETLLKIYAFIQDSIKELQNKYATAFVKVEGKDVIDVSAIVANQNDLDRLKKILADTIYYLRHVQSINAHTLKKIENDPYPERWTRELYSSKGKIKDANQIFKDYKKFLENFEKFGRNNFDEFKKKNGITNKNEADKIIDLLEKVQFIMQEKLKIDKNNQERQENIELIKEIINRIHEWFPNIVSPLTMDKLNATQDKASMVIFAESGAYESTLTPLAREVQTLIELLNAKLKTQVL